MCGLLGAGSGLVIRELKGGDGDWLVVAAGLALCVGSVAFLLLMILEYRSLLHFAIELEDHAEEREKRRAWAERMGKIAKQ
jgi:hypothetical protein